jgi:hypothetical protein
MSKALPEADYRFVFQTPKKDRFIMILTSETCQRISKFLVLGFLGISGFSGLGVYFQRQINVNQTTIQIPVSLNSGIDKK